MSWTWLHAPLPLLRKELTELAGRRRTYAVRAACGVAFFAVFLLAARAAARPEQAAQLIGSGERVFSALIWMQFAAIAVLAPAWMAGALAGERERGTLALLVVTDLRPTEILLQKYVSRLVPVLTLLLLALPLLGIAYAFGGVSPDYLASGIYLLFLACLQVGAVSLLCSAWCGSSAWALGTSYVAMAAISFALWCLDRALTPSIPPPGILALLFVPTALLPGAGWPELWLSGVWPLGPRPELDVVVVLSAPPMLTTLLLLFLARVALIRRPAGPGERGQGTMDRLASRLWVWAKRLAVRIVFGRAERGLPGEEPVAWRELLRHHTPTWRNELRVPLVLEVSLAALAVAISLSFPYSMDGCMALSAILGAVWLGMVAGLCIAGAALVAPDRTKRTLDLLLSTPLPGRAIVHQKLSFVRRPLLLIPAIFLTLIIAEARYDYLFASRRTPYGIQVSREERLAYALAAAAVGRGPRTPYLFELPLKKACAVYLVGSVLAVAIYLPTFLWLAVWLGLRIRRAAVAMLAAILVPVAWCAVPPLLAAAAGPSPWAQASLLSPGTVVWVLEVLPFRYIHYFIDGPAMAWIAGSFALHLGLLVLFRTLCLRRADRYLGRAVPRRQGDGA